MFLHGWITFLQDTSFVNGKILKISGEAKIIAQAETLLDIQTVTAERESYYGTGKSIKAKINSTTFSPFVTEIIAGNWTGIRIHQANGKIEETKIVIQNLQIEVEEKTDYEVHLEQQITIPIQKEFCQIGSNIDRFIKINDGWKEEHQIKKIDLKKYNFSYANINTDLKLVTCQANSQLHLRDYYEELNGYCTHFKNKKYTYAADEEGFGYDKDNKYVQFRVSTEDFKNANEFNSFIQETDIEMYLPLQERIL